VRGDERTLVAMGWRERVDGIRVLRRAGLLAPVRPDRLVRAGLAVARYGVSFAAGVSAAAARHPDRICIVDDRGTLTWREVDERTDALATRLTELGIGAGDLVALMCRNHRGFVEATAALAKIGASTLFLNTAFAGPQLREVLAREEPVALVYDEEFAGLLDAGHAALRTVVAWHDGAVDAPALDDLARPPAGPRPPRPPAPGRFVILTSGTTGTPKGAARAQATSSDLAVAMFERIPYHEGDVMCVPAPLFHSWGFGNLSIGLALGATFVLRRRFDPEATLADVARHRATVLAAVPVMLARILDLPKEVRRRYDTSSLRLVPLSGSAIPAGLAERFMDEFGDIVYNLYGSTEVGWATIATPADLRAAPGTAGRPPRGTVIRVLDPGGREVPVGEVGEVFVGSDLTFDGYTGGGSKPVIDGLMATGDTGRVDADGRLFVVGRADEMIVSGGENVYPREVEDLLALHPDVDDVAVVGAPDPEFGQRLVAFVVRRPGSTIDGDALKEHVRRNLARFKVPRAVEFVDELPRNPTGKVLKRELVERLG
jgi:acyl-CoA synthetase (AMP-forming)/AMP-acid ligase II